MKNLPCLLLIAIIISGCKKNQDPPPPPDYGSVQIKMHYSGANSGKSRHKTKSDTLYTQFGDYITSLTPSVFRAKFHTIRFLDNYEGINQIELINNNATLMDPTRYADFTNNNTITMNPEFSGDLQCTYDMTSCYFKNTTLLKYFLFRLWYFYQEVQIPAPYAALQTPPGVYQFGGLTNVGDPEAQNYGSLVGNYLTAQSSQFLSLLYPTTPIADVYVFGNTDSTFQYYVAPGDTIPNANNLMGDQNAYVIRSNYYNPFTFTPPAEGETKSYTAIVSFDYSNLIQVYAGLDNIPYTNDDVFVYAPNYWERLSVNVLSE